MWKRQLGESQDCALFSSSDSVSLPSSCGMRTRAVGFHSPAAFFSFPLDKAVAIIFSLPQGLPVGAVTAPRGPCWLSLRAAHAWGCGMQLREQDLQGNRKDFSRGTKTNEFQPWQCF